MRARSIWNASRSATMFSPALRACGARERGSQRGKPRAQRFSSDVAESSGAGRTCMRAASRRSHWCAVRFAAACGSSDRARTVIGAAVTENRVAPTEALVRTKPLCRIGRVALRNGAKWEAAQGGGGSLRGGVQAPVGNAVGGTVGGGGGGERTCSSSASWASRLVAAARASCSAPRSSSRSWHARRLKGLERLRERERKREREGERERERE